MHTWMIKEYAEEDCTTKSTKDTKKRILLKSPTEARDPRVSVLIFYDHLRALRVLRGKNNGQ